MTKLGKDYSTSYNWHTTNCCNFVIVVNLYKTTKRSSQVSMLVTNAWLLNPIKALSIKISNWRAKCRLQYYAVNSLSNDR